MAFYVTPAGVELPQEAFAEAASLPFELNDAWLAGAPRAQQFEAMHSWFIVRFFTINWTPPKDAPDELPDEVWNHPPNILSSRFEGAVPGDVIDELGNYLIELGGPVWLPTSFGEGYEPDFDIDSPDADLPGRALDTRLGQIARVLDLEGDDSTKSFACMLAFGAVITAIEGFLWETANYCLENDPDAVRRFTKLHHFKEKTVKFSEMFEQVSVAAVPIKGYLQGVVWHRWTDVADIYETGLEIKLPRPAAIQAAVVKRHDIVHRNGITKTGELIQVTREDVTELSEAARAFCGAVAERLTAKRRERRSAASRRD